MTSFSSFTLSLFILLAGYLSAICAMPPNPPTTPQRDPYGSDRIRLLTGTFAITTGRAVLISSVYHALVTLFYPPNTNNGILSAICPHPENLDPQIFTSSPTVVLSLLAIASGSAIRLSAFGGLGRNFTFYLSAPDRLITDGVYAYVQHPSYTGLVLVVLGCVGLFSIMGIFGRFLRLTTIGGAATVGGFFWYTRNDVFEPLPLTDRIFHSARFNVLNPLRNPTTHDLCIRRVPLSDIDPTLLEKKGKLVEAFCAGVWSGWGTHRAASIHSCRANNNRLGYAFQRAYLARKYQGPETAHQLWSRSELRSSSYEPGTLITDHFEVVEKTPDRIVVRCGASPRVQEVRPSDGLFEMSVKVKPEEGVAEFGLKSCFFQGLGKAETQPMPPHMVWLHQQYTKLWMETAIRNVVR
ncbi:uncharacterized protein CDV56_105351 [Aspergillus thermomutatus]|uniref:Protein-S-isoprenylcysteine O-methyltransferase n=1 Tax=Aspergillus thermomutatus TaxID=41047 RepID=A0A397H776_ASPTH|nr:uncharacterized protein CDV56_105351 [Aspergillus thermomutatus]RHZ58935.1 hypothetical protein CDV56_105351 [Aspergillus thermomutatus]